MSTPPRHPMPSRGSRQRGAVVLYIVLGLVVFGVLAAAGSTYFSSAVRGVLSPNCTAASRMMAESGLRYAAARLRAAANQAALDSAISAMNTHGAYDVGGGQNFTLSIGYDGLGNLQVNATGRGCSQSAPVNTALESVSVNTPRVGSQPHKDVVEGTDPFIITTNLGGDSPISVDPATGAISFGHLDQPKNAAAIWYNGNATSGCLDGNCTMNYGLRAVFDVIWTASSAADGLVFGVISGETNNVHSVGGNPYQGELMGWGGPALKKDGTMGTGIMPPKFGLEFDTYENGCGSLVYTPGSRCDSSARDHMAYVFWGGYTSLNTTYCPSPPPAPPDALCVTIKGTTYDDNRHGAGAGNASEPISYGDLDGTGSGRFGYYYGTYNEWLTGRTSSPVIAPVKYAVRHEISRIGTRNAEGNYPYVLKSWVQNAPGSTAYYDVTQNYTTSAPNMQRVVHLTPTLHAQMAKVLFGWAEATGDSTQKLTVSSFKLAFKNAAETLTIPTGYSVYWNMNSIPGTSIGTVTTGTQAGYSYGQYLIFSDDTGRVSVNDSNSLDLTTAGAIAVWIYPTTLGAASQDTYILHKGTAANTSNEAYYLRLNDSAQLELTIRDGGGTSSITSSALPAANRWYHVVAQWDGTVLAIYVNGMLNNVLTNTSGRAARNSNANLVIGARHTAGIGPYKGFRGYIDEIYLYKRFLTASEIAAMSLMP